MNILVTGAGGFIGRNLCETLKTIRDKRNKSHPKLDIEEVFEYDIGTGMTLLDEYCAKADFVFNLAGVNRPKDETEFIMGNHDFALKLLNKLNDHQNRCPVMLASTIQATLIGQYEESDYGKSKLAAESLFFRYGAQANAPVLVYRFPDLFGKWCRPDYNSAVATLCNNIANDIPFQIEDRNVQLALVHIDDLIEEMLNALEGKAHRCDFIGLKPKPSKKGRFCYVPVMHQTTIGKIVDMLTNFRALPETLLMPDMPKGSFAQKLYSTYLTYLPKSAITFPLKMVRGAQGVYAELLKSKSMGQLNIDICKPGDTKGQHWHSFKCGFIVVLSGYGLIQERRIGTDENGDPNPVLEFAVSGDHLEVVQILPGYTHCVTNLSDTDDLVTIMWSSEIADPKCKDTFFENVFDCEETDND